MGLLCVYVCFFSSVSLGNMFLVVNSAPHNLHPNDRSVPMQKVACLFCSKAECKSGEVVAVAGGVVCLAFMQETRVCVLYRRAVNVLTITTIFPNPKPSVVIALPYLNPNLFASTKIFPKSKPSDLRWSLLLEVTCCGLRLS